MLPRQPYTRYGVCHVVDPTGHADAGVPVTNIELVSNE